MTVFLLLLACTRTDGSDAGSSDTGSDTSDTGIPDARAEALLAAIEADLRSSNATGASVAVWVDGAVVLAAGVGSADPDGDVPVTPTMLFQIGSTTKMMAAATLLQQVDRGRVGLDEPMSSVLPDIRFVNAPDAADALTPRMLLSHQGGFYDYVDWTTGPDDEGLREGMEQFAEQLFLMSPPGAFWNYSNPNFSFAGGMVEELDGRAWADVVRQDVLAPLGMARSTARKADVEADGDFALSFGYDERDLRAWGTPEIGTVAMEDVPEPAFVRPAGLVWSTPSEMVRFAHFLMAGDAAVLSEAMRTELTASQVETLYLGGAYDYGFGLFVSEGFFDSAGAWRPVPMWDHGGNTLSFTSHFYMLPQEGIAVSILSNGYGDSFGRSVAVAFEQYATLPEPSEAPDGGFDPDGLDAHVGTYTDAWNVGPVEVTREGDTLFVSMPLLEEYGIPYQAELEPESTDVWYARIDGSILDLTFVRGADGGTQYIRNRAFVAARDVDGLAPAQARTPTRMDVARALSHPASALTYPERRR